MNRQIKYFHTADAGLSLVRYDEALLSYPLHNHISVFTIGVVLSGAILLTLNGVKRLIEANQAFMIPPYAPHSLEAAGRYTMASLCLSREFIEGKSEDELVDATEVLLDKAFDKIKPGARAQIRFFLKVLYLGKGQGGPATGPGHLQKLKRRIEQYPEDSLTIAEMSRQTSISKYHLIRSFKRAIGLTPHQFQIQNRVRKAQRLLNNPISMAEVALTAGFFDQSHFIRHFERIVGLSPAHYKAACRFVP